MLAECTHENCTVAATGNCLLNNDPDTCPHRRAADEAPSLIIKDELLREPEKNPPFKPSATLAEAALGELMSSRYCTMIGIIGPPNSGKTAALVSTYLLLSRGKLEGFEYADSKSLMALDEISRGARRWNAGHPPDQMTAHTEMAEDRVAGFLHLRMRQTSDRAPIDVLLPDLPGEWSTAMVDESRHERLEFLNRCDVLWMMMDGTSLSKGSTRQYEIHRAKLYLQRLKQFFPNLPRILLVVTRADEETVPDRTIEEIKGEALSLGMEIEVRRIASFSMNPAIDAGAGIADLLQTSLGVTPASQVFWPVLTPDDTTRAMHATVVGGIDP